jgi:hypothetical protein
LKIGKKLFQKEPNPEINNVEILGFEWYNKQLYFTEVVKRLKNHLEV